jgi:hypothetical protein
LIERNSTQWPTLLESEKAAGIIVCDDASTNDFDVVFASYFSTILPGLRMRSRMLRCNLDILASYHLLAPTWWRYSMNKQEGCQQSGEQRGTK